ncbi:MAG: hypothetical protein HKN73_01150 [Gemmatimonadetes bacterium]|nr:hypothetical protein [Gemmatimonadota bacterium]
MRSIALAGLILAVSTGCTYSHQTRSPFDRPATETTRLTVRNDHPVDVRIAVLQGSVAVPVGRVGGLSSARMQLSALQLSEVGPIRFQIRESNGDHTVQTLPVLAGPGHPIHLRVNHGLEQSTATVQ